MFRGRSGAGAGGFVPDHIDGARPRLIAVVLAEAEEPTGIGEDDGQQKPLAVALHQVEHVFDSWDAMTPVSEQMGLPGSRTNPDLVAARFLLKPCRKYEQAVKAFLPYDSIKEENPEARAAGRALIAEGRAVGQTRRTFVFVNNRLEGNAISTIAAMLEPG